MDVPQKLNLEPPYGPVMLHLGLYQKWLYKSKSSDDRDEHTPILPVALWL